MSRHIYEEACSKSSQETTRSMTKHFNTFIKTTYSLSSPEHHQFSDLKYDKLQPSDVTDKLVGHFLNYLVTAQPFKKNSSGNDYISYQSMTNYASSFKNQLLRKFSNENYIPNPIKDEFFKKYTAAMRSRKIKQINALDKPVFGEYKAATDEDITALSTLTYWSNEQEYAEFLFLMNSMISNCGRGSEVSSNFS